MKLFNIVNYYSSTLGGSFGTDCIRFVHNLGVEIVPSIVSSFSSKNEWVASHTFANKSPADPTIPMVNGKGSAFLGASIQERMEFLIIAPKLTTIFFLMN